jgi:hypothetical protein
MNINEAYEYVIERVKDLQEKGIRVEKLMHEPTEKHLKDFRGYELSPDKWCTITFYPKTEKELELVFDGGFSLVEKGISFDSGGGFGGRDWEIDWSFSCK